MKIVFFGTPEFAVPSLKSLYRDKEIEILAVVTQPDRPSGRTKKITPPPIQVLAKKLKLTILQPANQEELKQQVSPLNADFFVVIAYGMILDQDCLKMPKIAPVNVHASLLPKYRGASPIQESLLHGDRETGISIMKMSEKLDQGDIYLIKRIAIENNDNFESLHSKLAVEVSLILPNALYDIAQCQLAAIPQSDTQASYCRKIHKTDGKIDWNKTSEEILNMIRAYTPWPSAYTDFHGKNLKILDAENISTESPIGICTFSRNTVAIGTAKGSLLLKKVQIEGKKPMDISEFINGYSMSRDMLKNPGT